MSFEPKATCQSNLSDLPSTPTGPLPAKTLGAFFDQSSGELFDPTEDEIVSWVFDLYARGKSPQQIVSVLDRVPIQSNSEQGDGQ